MNRTPGPWRVGVNQYGGAHVVCADDLNPDGGLVCETPGGGNCGLQLNDSGKARSMANAKLIAAAPDLVEALQSLERAVSAFHAHDFHPCLAPIFGDMFDQVRAARAAIAKAGI